MSDIVTFKLNETIDDNKNLIPIAAVKVKDYDVDNIIKKELYHDIIYSNSIGNYQVVKIENNIIPHYSSTELEKCDFIIASETNKRNEPLFYYYDLRFEAFGFSDTDIIEIYKNNEQLVHRDKYTLKFCTKLKNDKSSPQEYENFNNSNSIHNIRVFLPIEFFNTNDFFTVRYNKYLFGNSYPNYSEIIQCNIIENSKNITYDDYKNKYICKNPDKQIKIDNFGSFGDPSSDQTMKSWHVRVKHGEFIYNNTLFSSSFNSLLPSNDQYEIINKQKGQYICSNIFKLEPFHIEETQYPNYIISDKTAIGDTEDYGIEIYVNNVKSKVKVLSYNKFTGYVLLDSFFDVTDNVEFSYYVDDSIYYYIKNLQLNPRITSEETVNIKTTKNVGIAVNSDGKLYIFDFDNIETFYEAGRVPTHNNPISGSLIWNPYSDIINDGAKFLPIGSLKLNKLTPDDIEIFDVRKIGGGLTDETMKNVPISQSNSYTTYGYYDGRPMPGSNLVIIHLKDNIIENLVDRWLNSNMYTKSTYTGLTIHEIEKLKKESIGTGYNPIDEEVYEEDKKRWATKEAHRYMDSLIKKYIPAGSEYILMNEKFEHVDLLLE